MWLIFIFKVFCGKIPKDVFEDELIPLFEKCGPIWDLRLMMDPMTGFNRGYSFITYCDRDGANEAVKQVCLIIDISSVCTFLPVLHLPDDPFHLSKGDLTDWSAKGK